MGKSKDDIPKNVLFKDAVINCYACGGPVYKVKAERVKSFDPIRHRDFCAYDGRELERNERMICPHCGEPFFTIAIGTAQAVPRDWPLKEL